MTSKHPTIKAVLGAGALLLVALPSRALEKRGETQERVSGYTESFFKRENRAFRIGAAIHFAHGYAHDILQLTPLSRHAQIDDESNRKLTDFVRGLKARTEPTQEVYAPYTARMAWKTLRTIDWTHKLHSMTYDVMADKNIAWNDKERMLNVVDRYYYDQEQEGIPRSPAPLDITMRRAGVMMKPYFSFFRNYYPKMNNYFYAAHWWHPAIYEAQMIAGNSDAQQVSVEQADDTFFNQVLVNRPLRMILTRELMPRYSRLDPQSGNSFDNLHMLHGIVYDIMAYEGYTPEQKKAELYRVIKAMSYQPGDEKLARKFSTPHPDVDPRVYEPWMQNTSGEMNRIMREMMMEMMPMMFPSLVPAGMSQEQMAGMSPDEIVAALTPEQKQKHDALMLQFRMKMTPGIQPGEREGSLHDALMAQANSLGVEMKMMPGMMESMQAGKTPQMMIDAMLRGYHAKYDGMPDIALYPMVDPGQAPPLPLTRPAILPTGSNGGQVADQLVMQMPGMNMNNMNNMNMNGMGQMLMNGGNN